MKLDDPRLAALFAEVRANQNLDPRITLDHYRNNGALLVMFQDDRLSVNLPGFSERMQPGIFAVKDWSENTDIARKAWESGLFEDTGVSIPTGYVSAPVWKIKNYGKSEADGNQ